MTDKQPTEIELAFRAGWSSGVGAGLQEATEAETDECWRNAPPRDRRSESWRFYRDRRTAELRDQIVQRLTITKASEHTDLWDFWLDHISNTVAFVLVRRGRLTAESVKRGQLGAEWRHEWTPGTTEREAMAEDAKRQVALWLARRLIEDGRPLPTNGSS